MSEPPAPGQPFVPAPSLLKVLKGQNFRRVGLTYDLRQSYLERGYSAEEVAELDSPDTIDAIERALWEQGHHVVRIGDFAALSARLAAGERWDLVFNICEGLHGVAREAEVPALLEAHRIPYTFSEPHVLALTLDKAATKRAVAEFGVPTAAAVVVAGDADLAAVELPYPLFCKPLTEGSGKGISAASHVTGPAELAAQCRRLIAQFQQPVLVETFLPGREFTVGIVGTGAQARSLGALEVLLRPGAEPHGHTYANKVDYQQWVDYAVACDPEAQKAAAIALQVYRLLGCRDAGRVDIRSDGHGQPHFLEINPLAGLHPVHSDLTILATRVGLRHSDLICEIMSSCLARIAEPEPAEPVLA